MGRSVETGLPQARYSYGGDEEAVDAGQDVLELE
jgi:hypothetical protein